MKLVKTKTLFFYRKHFKRFAPFFLFALLLFQFPAPNVYFGLTTSEINMSPMKEFTLSSPPPIPVNLTGTQPPVLSAQGVLVIDLPSDMVIYQKNGEGKFFPASTTKVATALVALDHYRLDDILTVKTIVNEGRKMGLLTGEQLTFEALLYGTLVHSANDAAYTIAENYPGGLTSFVAAMNEKAKSLGLFGTHFTNPVGFEDENNYTTAYDLAKLAKVALSNKIFTKIVSTKSITVSDITFTYFHDLKNVNELLGKVAGVSGVKTGFTPSAGEILISQVKKNGREVLIVVLKSNDRFGDTEKIISWIFENFVWKELKELTNTTQAKMGQSPVNKPQNSRLLQRQI